MRRPKHIFRWIIIADLLATALFWGATRFVDETKSLDGGTGIVFYTDSESEADIRIDTGIDLLKTGKLDRLVMVGGHRPQEGRLGSQEMALTAIRRSGLGGQISADVNSRDTFSGLRNAMDIVSKQGGEEVVFVSDCMHLVRVDAVYHAINDDALPSRNACTGGSYNPLTIWADAHYEAGSWIAYLMPDSWREGILDRLRGSEPNAE